MVPPATQEQILTWLEEVKDPEIPVLSLIDLGVITSVSIHDHKVAIEMTPTFVGCPALEIMKEEIIAVLHAHDVTEAEVVISYREPWTSDRISEKGRMALKKFGLAPPAGHQVFTDLEILENVVCPRCDSDRTELKNIFGSTLCRSIYYCRDCRETFEQFKPI